MKSLKKFLLIVALTTIFGVSAFAESGFEFILNVPLQMSLGIPSKFLKDNAEAKGEKGFDYGVSAQFGYMARVTRSFGISLLAEVGYSHDNFALSINARDIGVQLDERVKFSFDFESLQVGLLPKLNIGNFSIGIGGGIKIPYIGGKETVTIGSQKNSVKLSRSDIKNILEPDYIGYIKGTLDYSIFLTDRFALNLGLYLGYDFINAKILIGDNKNKVGSFDVGGEIGLRFAPSR